jgi:nitrate reductase NapAB chaperone NapD
MILSGLSIHIMSEKLEQVKSRLQAINGLEVQDIIDDHKIIATIAYEAKGEEEAVIKEIMGIDGVLVVNHVYDHHLKEDIQNR